MRIGPRRCGRFRARVDYSSSHNAEADPRTQQGKHYSNCGSGIAGERIGRVFSKLRQLRQAVIEIRIGFVDENDERVRRGD